MVCRADGGDGQCAVTTSATSERDPLVSCIIIFLNEERFLEEAIRSVFAQTYPNWELMLVDDGSTDRSSEIARRYAADNPERVRYLEHPAHENRGMSASRNLGFSHTHGCYIALLDGDDAWLPNKLVDQVAILNDHPDAAMTYGRTRFWYGWTGDRVHRRREWLTPLGVPPNQIVAPPVLLTNFLRNESTGLSNCSVLVRREVVEQVGGWEDEFRTLYEDMVLWTKILSRWPAFVSDRTWDLYRQHPGNSAVSAAVEGIWTSVGPNPARKRFLEWMSTYLHAHGVQDRPLLETLAAQLDAHRPQDSAPWRRIGPAVQRLAVAARELVENVRANELVQRVRLSAAAERWLGPVPDYLPPVGYVQFGDLRRLTPLGRSSDIPDTDTVERHDIECFLREHAGDLRGRLVEVGRVPLAKSVAGSSVTHYERHDAPGPDSTLADIAPATADCVVCIDPDALIPEPQTIVRQLHDALKPGGVLLVALPGVVAMPRDTARWPAAGRRFTPRAARRVFQTCFEADHLNVASGGNVCTVVAALERLSARELGDTRLSHRDPRYPLVVYVRAVKANVTGSRHQSSAVEAVRA